MTGSTSSLVYNSESIRKRPGREEPHDDHTVPQKVHYQTYWKRNQDVIFWITVTKSAGLRIADREFHRPSEVPVLRQSHRDPASPQDVRTRKQAAAKLPQPSVFQCSVLTSTRKLDAVIMLEG